MLLVAAAFTPLAGFVMGIAVGFAQRPRHTAKAVAAGAVLIVGAVWIPVPVMTLGIIAAGIGLIVAAADASSAASGNVVERRTHIMVTALEQTEGGEHCGLLFSRPGGSIQRCPSPCWGLGSSGPGACRVPGLSGAYTSATPVSAPRSHAARNSAVRRYDRSAS